MELENKWEQEWKWKWKWKWEWKWDWKWSGSRSGVKVEWQWERKSKWKWSRSGVEQKGTCLQQLPKVPQPLQWDSRCRQHLAQPLPCVLPLPPVALFPFSLASSTPSTGASSGGLRGEEGDIGRALPLVAAASAGCWQQLFWARIDGRRRHRHRRQRGQSTAGLRGRDTPGKNPTGCRGLTHDALSLYPMHCASRERGSFP